MKLIYPAIFTPCLENPGYTPDLKGCVSEGNSLENAIEMGAEAACGWILGELEDGNAVPIASDYKLVITVLLHRFFIYALFLFYEPLLFPSYKQFRQ